MYKLVMFDLDGTLVNSIPDLTFAINKTLLQLEHNEVSAESVKKWVGNGVPLLLARALSNNVIPDVTISKEMQAEAIALFNEAYHESGHSRTHLFNEVLESLTKLKELDCQMAIITSKPYQFVPTILNNLNITDFFSDIIGGDSVKNRKPDPEGINSLLAKYNLKSSEVLMVGDSENDILAAKNATCDSVGFTYGYNYGKPISESNPTYVCDTFSELLEIVNNKK